MNTQVGELTSEASPGRGVATGLWVGGLLMLAVLRAWLAGAAGAALAGLLIGDTVAAAIAVGAAVTILALPYRAVRAAQRELRGEMGEDRTDFRRGLILAMLMAVAALWLSMLTFLSISNQAAAVPGGMMGALVIVATVASAAAVLASTAARREPRDGNRA